MEPENAHYVFQGEEAFKYILYHSGEIKGDCAVPKKYGIVLLLLLKLLLMDIL